PLSAISSRWLCRNRAVRTIAMSPCEPLCSLDGFSHAPVEWAQPAGIAVGAVEEITLFYSTTIMMDDYLD
ncbi:hypothetical protein, partial [Acinetobacter baumannii]|uniref:hypothetical protein n=1 Tax=Acinetobacter baumannii TaxID=470 RepID=UPI001C089AB1